MRTLALFQTLSSLGILSALEITLSSDDLVTKNTSVDVLTYVIEFSPSVVREYTLSQVGNTDDHDSMLINIIIEQVICDVDPELVRAVQLMSNLRLLIDPETMLAIINKTEKTEFLTYFYKHSIQLLIGENLVVLDSLFLTSEVNRDCVLLNPKRVSPWFVLLVGTVR